MQTQNAIEKILREHFNPVFFELHNESDQHAGPATDSHFKVIVVSDLFAGLSPVARHRAVYAVLKNLMPQPVHALALHTYTPDQWADRSAKAPESPACRGGSVVDKNNA